MHCSQHSGCTVEQNQQSCQPSRCSYLLPGAFIGLSFCWSTACQHYRLRHWTKFSRLYPCVWGPWLHKLDLQSWIKCQALQSRSGQISPNGALAWAKTQALSVSFASPVEWGKQNHQICRVGLCEIFMQNTEPCVCHTETHITCWLLFGVENETFYKSKQSRNIFKTASKCSHLHPTGQATSHFQ